MFSSLKENTGSHNITAIEINQIAFNCFLGILYQVYKPTSTRHIQKWYLFAFRFFLQFKLKCLRKNQCNPLVIDIK